MIKQKLIKYAILFLTAFFAVILVLSLHFGVSAPEVVPQTQEIVNADGNTVTAVRISDIGKLSTLNFVNYSPNEYVKLGSNPQGEIVELGGNHKPAKRGTYQFVLLNLEPMDTDFNRQAEALAPFFQGDVKWHVTLQVPKIWSACNVYVDWALVSRVGEISDYNFIDYCDYQEVTPKHKNETEQLFLDITFPTKREVIPADSPLTAARIITIHYEADSGRIAGLDRAPLIGLDKDVRAAAGADTSALTIAVIISALSLAIFIFLCFLKRTLSFLPQLLIALGVFGVLISALGATGLTAFPYLWAALSALSFAFILFAAVLAQRVKIKKFPIWIIFAAFTLINCVLAFAAPLSPLALSSAFAVYMKTAFVITACAVIVFTGYSAYRALDPTGSVNPLLAAITAISAVFLPAFTLGVGSPVMWLLIAMILATVIFSFRVFIGIERRNAYLTLHLSNEVKRQTKDIQAVLNEHDELLRYVSHDLKKPVSSMQTFLRTLREREDDDEQIKALDIVSQKANELNVNLTNLGRYEKQSFVAEAASVLDTDELLREAYNNLEPDCTANGIVLKCTSASVSFYGKRNALISVLNNLILNSIEHSNCKAITLSAYKKRNLCHITVTDDGKGIPAGRNVFKPYYSENEDGDNLGLGLYLCKSLVTSMGGELTYEQNDGKLTFSIILPIV